MVDGPTTISHDDKEATPDEHTVRARASVSDGDEE
jgi:hypothetical protein